VPAGYTVGVLVQSNFGGQLTIAGVPVGSELAAKTDGSIMMVVATDAPLDHRNLQRLAARTMTGLARTGSAASNGSGDYAIAFSTAPGGTKQLANDQMSPLFLAAIESTEEAIYNSLLRASTISGSGHTVEALPVDRTIKLLRARGVLR
jgi:D-aminopeptidase